MLVLLFIAIPLLAATTVQTVTEVSAQQAIIRVRTNQASCSHAITETATTATSVAGAIPDDVNTTLFPGSNLDTRAGSIVNGPDRAFVFGQRTGALASDGQIHSRSAKVNTAYTDAWTCGSDTGTAYFTTGNIQNGGTVTEQPPFSSSGFGNYAWPTINWSNQSTQYTDPMSGIVIQRVTFPGMWGEERALANFDFATGGSGWTNPQNVLLGTACAGTSTNCGQTANANPIFLSIKGQNFVNGSGCEFSSGYSSCDTYDDFLVTLTGLASAAQNITVCLSYYDSGATCQTANQTIALGTSVSTAGFPAAGVGYASGANMWSAQFRFAEWGGTAPKRGDFGMAFGTAGESTGVTTSGTAVTGACYNNSQSMSCFNVNWNNAYIYIAGSGCTDGGTNICQINGHPADTEHLTLKNAPATACASQCNWNSLAAGVRITAGGSGTVDIGAQYSYALSAMFSIAAEGDSQQCNSVPVSVGYKADGITPINPPVPGQLCAFQFQSTSGAAENAANSQAMLMIPSTGEVRLLSPLYAPPGVDSADAAGDQNGSQIIFPLAPWDGTTGNCMYGYAQTATAGKYSIYKACYNTAKNWKAYSHSLWAPGVGPWCQCVPGQDPAQGFPGARWSDDPMVYTNITPPSTGKDIGAQMAAHNTTWNATMFPLSFLSARAANDEMIFSINQQGNAVSSLNFFNLSTGNIQAWGDTLFTPPLQFCGFHSAFIGLGAGGHYAIACDYLSIGNPSIPFGGPFQSTPYYVYFGGTPNTNTAIGACGGTGPCDSCSSYTISAPVMATIVAGGVQNQCMHIRMKKVTSHTPQATELALYPSSQNASWSEPTVVGVGTELVLPNVGGFGENDWVAAVTTGVTDAACSSDCLDLVVVRGFPTGSNGCAGSGCAIAEANGWTVAAGPGLGACSETLGAGCQPGVGYWVSSSATGNIASTAVAAPELFAGHSDAGTGLTSSAMTFNQGNRACYNQTTLTCTQNLGTPADTSNQLIVSPPFYGTGGFGNGSGCIQAYPSNEQYTAPTAQEKRWGTDFHHYNPSSAGAGLEQFVAIPCSISSSPAGGFSTVYLITASGGALTPSEPNYKAHGLAAWGGHNLLQDVSGPGSSLSDSSPYQVCQALKAGECVSGSGVNNVYVTLPYVPGSKPFCIVDWFVENYPCVLAGAPSVGAWLVQSDLSGSYALFESARKLTMGFTGYGRQYQYNTFIAEATGTWGLFRADWLDGIRTEIMMAHLPPFPGGTSIPRSTFVNLPVKLPAGAAFAEIKFGYMENGSAQAYYCTPRQDACTTSGAPFAYPSIDTRTPVSCSSGCTVNIPAIAGRAVYYSVGSSANGTTWTYGAPQVGLVQ